MGDFIGKRIGIIGGSGIRKLSALSGGERLEVETPFGKPSDAVVLGTLGDVPVAFLQRHGPGHVIPPSEINVRANIAALRRVGCRQIISLSAVGSLQERCTPGCVVLVDQFIDRTFRRESTFFGRGLVGHVSFGDPVCQRMRSAIQSSAAALPLTVVGEGTYIVMEGPQFSTRAESNLHRRWGGTVVGMTAMPEAKLAREAEMCYAMIAITTDFDCWSERHAPVTAELVNCEMQRVTEQVNALVAAACRSLSSFAEHCPFGCTRALKLAIMTNPEQRDPAMQARFDFFTHSVDPDSENNR
jgi:5'-methylthioadenosine phosphorylase